MEIILPRQYKGYKFPKSIVIKDEIDKEDNNIKDILYSLFPTKVWKLDYRGWSPFNYFNLVIPRIEESKLEYKEKIFCQF